ncbi:uncharacterized protein LOC120106648 [Phoenix dactylifera]|uniref:Uncharacterized protein LOC120106648 n=1 Tax=Phoenix dactylifera TaxID=42345 RepID=A0A8B8ZW35_PHODC|nr:uncharacterized protein LOC120106648 [Phoenix dactylifera]
MMGDLLKVLLLLLLFFACSYSSSLPIGEAALEGLLFRRQPACSHCWVGGLSGKKEKKKRRNDLTVSSDQESPLSLRTLGPRLIAGLLLFLDEVWLIDCPPPTVSSVSTLTANKPS